VILGFANIQTEHSYHQCSYYYSQYCFQDYFFKHTCYDLFFTNFVFTLKQSCISGVIYIIVTYAYGIIMIYRLPKGTVVLTETLIMPEPQTL